MVTKSKAILKDYIEWLQAKLDKGNIIDIVSFVQSEPTLRSMLDKYDDEGNFIGK